MTTKDIRKAIKEGQKVTFNRHISGCMSYERFPVVGVKEVHGATWVKFVWRMGYKPTWGAVQRDLDDYVSAEPLQSKSIWPTEEECKAFNKRETLPAVGAPGFCKILIPEVK